MTKIDLQHSAWCSIVFEGRNQDYGAFRLRKIYSGNMLKAFFLAAFGFGSLAYAPILASRLSGNTFSAQGGTRTVAPISVKHRGNLVYLYIHADERRRY